jgi:hypothetical protein
MRIKYIKIKFLIKGWDWKQLKVLKKNKEQMRK